jgi:hypothetical protein
MERKRLTWLFVALAVVAEPARIEPGDRSAVHEGIDCLRCHTEYSGVQDALCLDCHEEVLVLPWHSGAGGDEDCNECHYEHVGSDYITDLTEVPPHPDRPTALSGVHTPLRCVECHWAANTTGECSFCHERFIGDTHEVGFTSECDLCHIQSIWDVEYDHDHEKAECVDCHGDDPDHLYPGYIEWSRECDACHAVELWLIPEFDHEEVGEPCELCHPSSLDLDHAGRSSSCTHCHGIEAWTPQHIDHDELDPPCIRCHDDDRPAEHLTDPELAPLDCNACHVAGESWRRIVNHTQHVQPCIQCHGEASELHVYAYSDDCQWCHLPERRDLLATHPNQTVECTDCHIVQHVGGDPLRSVDAAHADRCSLCHQAGEAWEAVSIDHEALGRDCYSCHEPPHGAIGAFSVGCEACHGTDQWVPVVVDHDLLGDDCQSCHVTSHPNAKDRYSQDCELCHVTDDWSDRLWSPDHELADGIMCVNCHDDIHRGTLGIICEDCHTTDTWATDVINP